MNAAFAPAIHRYRWHGELHLANATNCLIPRALAAVVACFASLHDFRHQPQRARSKLNPLINLSGGARAVAQRDFASIYALTRTFRLTFGMLSSLPTVVFAGSDPGLVANDQTESDLDLEWAGGVAPSAALKFVTAKSTSITDGVTLPALYAVDQNLADVITLSYGSCESSAAMSVAGARSSTRFGSRRRRRAPACSGLPEIRAPPAAIFSSPSMPYTASA